MILIIPGLCDAEAAFKQTASKGRTSNLAARNSCVVERPKRASCGQKTLAYLDALRELDMNYVRSVIAWGGHTKAKRAPLELLRVMQLDHLPLQAPGCFFTLATILILYILVLIIFLGILHY